MDKAKKRELEWADIQRRQSAGKALFLGDTNWLFAEVGLLREELAYWKARAETNNSETNEQRAEVERLKGIETNLRQLLAQHDLHWGAVAAALGGICCGGVDVPVSEPTSTGGAIVAAIMALRGEGEDMKDAATIALEALGHVKVPNTRCTARYKDNPASGSGPRNPPIWCDLKAGHEGPHRHVTGHHSAVMAREHLIEMVPLPDVCQKCGTKWPCKEAGAVINAFAETKPCACYPEHCTDTSHGKCWCEPTREGNLIIHNQPA